MDSTKVRNYSKKELIGKGTFGKIFKAQRDGSEKLVALKVVDLTKAGKKDNEHVQNEVKILQECQHKNLVQFIEWFSIDNYIYIVMGLCNGGNLREHIQGKKGLDEESCIHILEQICDGLKYLHDKNIAHRDVKTTNILLQKQNGELLIKIGDFGLAKVMETVGPAALTTCVGSPYFMSPEMIAGQAYDISTDIWSLGCCAYEMATTDVPYEAKEMDRLKDRIKTDRVDYTKIPYSQDIQGLIMAMMEKDKTRRPSAAQIITFLHQHNHTEKVKDNKEQRKTDTFAKTWSPGTKIQPTSTAGSLVNRYDTSGYGTTEENEEEGYITEIVPVPVKMTEDDKDCLAKARQLQKDILKRIGGSSDVLDKINSSIQQTKHMDGYIVFMNKMEELLDKTSFERCKADLGALWSYRTELMKKDFKIAWS